MLIFVFRAACPDYANTSFGTKSKIVFKVRQYRLVVSNLRATHKMAPLNLKQWLLFSMSLPICLHSVFKSVS